MKIGIIGGGIAGSATAYYLSKTKSQITIFEKDFVGAHSSGKSNGSIIPFIENDKNGSIRLLSDYSLNIHNKLMKQFKDIYYVKKPVMHLFTNNEDSIIYENYLNSQNDTNSHLLSLNELRHIDARVSDNVSGGLFIKNSLEVDSFMLTKSLLDHSIENGVNFVKENVNRIEINSRNKLSIHTQNQIYSFDKIIIANGPWANQLIKDLSGKDMITPIKGQILRLKNIFPKFKISFWWGKNYITTKENNISWLGTTHENIGYDEEPTFTAKKNILDNAKKIFPFMDEKFIDEQTACLRPMTKDSLPIIGRISNNENIFICGGGSANGILFGPAMGKTIYKYIFNEELDNYIYDFSVDRFL
ncbi:MAG: NAD(P)/FAD-dependent oxidoreductase [Dehalococcoidia bacterium]